MPIHISLLDDAVSEFVSAFGAYRRLADGRLKRARERGLEATRLLRSAYIAFEKALKHAIMRQEPFLVIERLEPKLLLQLSRDMHARPVPSVLCARPPFKTITAEQAWELVRNEYLSGIDSGKVDGFGTAFDKLCGLRHRAQHAELYVDLEDVVSTVERAFASMRPVFEACTPAFLEGCYKRNAQLESRLAALENKLDGSWVVLTRYLSNRSSPLTFTCTLNAYLDADGSQRLFFDRSGDSVRAELLFSPTAIPAANATGLFASLLSQSEAQERASKRVAALGAPAFGAADATNFLMGLLTQKRAVPEPQPIMPLDTGRLDIPMVSAWITLRLPRVRPSVINTRCIMYEWRLAFEQTDKLDGSVRGSLLWPDDDTFEQFTYIPVKGALRLLSEIGIDADPNRDWLTNGGTSRRFLANLSLEKPRKGRVGKPAT